MVTLPTHRRSASYTYALKSLTVHIHGSNVDALRRQLDELCELGVRRGLCRLRYLSDAKHDAVSYDIPVAVKAGWIRL